MCECANGFRYAYMFVVSVYTYLYTRVCKGICVLQH